MTCADFDFAETPSFTIATPMNDAALGHLEARTEGTWHGGGLICESRYAPELSRSLVLDGFSVALPDGRVVTAEDLRECA